MKMKLTFTDLEDVGLFVSAVLFLSKQSDRIIFGFKKDDIFLITEKPYTWIEFPLKYMTNVQYTFEGQRLEEEEEGDDDSECIFLEGVSSHYASTLVALCGVNATKLDIKLSKTSGVILLFEAAVEEEGGINLLQFELPASFLQPSEWQHCDPKQLNHKFDLTCHLPKFSQLKKYIDNFKKFTHLRFMVNDSILAIEGEKDETRMRTVFLNPFDDTSAEHDGEGSNSGEEDSYLATYEVQVLSKSFVGFLSSISSMHFHDIYIKCTMIHHKLLQFSFTVSQKDITFNFILEHINESECSNHGESSIEGERVVPQPNPEH